MSVTATTIGSYDQLFRLRVALKPHAEPPTPNGLHGEGRGVMVGTNADPGLIGSDVIDTLRIGAPELLVDEIVNLDFDGLAAG